MTKPDLSEHELETMFASARRTVPLPDDDFLARLAADAAHFAETTAGPTAPLVTTQVPWWSQMRSVFGGWGGMGGVIAATIAGVWIGVAPPSDVLDPAALVSGGFDDVGAFDELLSFAETSLFELEDG